MNLVGKIFTVLIFVMSLLFMGVAVTVYATHTNWREAVVGSNEPGKPKGLQPRLKEARTRNEELKDQKARLEQKLAKESKAAEQVRAKLEQEMGLLATKFKNLQEESRVNDEERRKMTATLAATEAESKAYRIENEGVDGKGGLRAKIVKAEQDKDAQFKIARKLEDDLHQAVNKLQLLRDQQVTLAEDLARARAVLQNKGLTEHEPLEVPDVEGFVVAFTNQGAEVLVEISIGTDDGLRKKHRLHVFRPGPGAYVGDVEVVETYPDKVVCTIVPKTLQSPIRRGDYVASRLD